MLFLLVQKQNLVEGNRDDCVNTITIEDMSGKGHMSHFF